MAITTHLDIVSAAREIFSGLVEMLIATAAEGEVGIVPGHAPLLTMLKPGELRIKRSGGRLDIYYVSGGILEVQPQCITVLADEVERADHLDEAAALAAKAHAESQLASTGNDIDYALAQTELARAMAQIRAIYKTRHRHSK